MTQEVIDYRTWIKEKWGGRVHEHQTPVRGHPSCGLARPDTPAEQCLSSSNKPFILRKQLVSCKSLKL